MEDEQIDSEAMPIKNIITNGGDPPMKGETILLRVKRPRDADDLHEMYLEYDVHGKIQKTKFISETDALKNALSLF